MPVKVACRIALAVFLDMVGKQGKGTPEQQLKAALWLTSLMDDQ